MIGLLDAWWIFLRDFVGAHPALIGVPLGMFIIAGFVLKRAVPSEESRFNGWIRIARYCHDCPYADLPTLGCSINATADEKCGLIYRTAGLTFEVKKTR